MPDLATDTAARPAQVLVVDDEPDLAELVRQKFRRRVRRGELAFHFASDGQEALDQIRAHPDLDLVLTDINMPRMDGLTLLKELAELDGAHQVVGAVVVTAYGDMLNIRTAMNRGAFDFLTKPIDLDDLEVTVDRAVAMVRAQKRALHARQTAARYLSDEVAQALLADPEATKLGGERRRLTLLMADLRGFAAFSETLPPERVLEILNVYLGTMAEVIGEFGGTIDEFIGDGILVIFGAPAWREDHARRAVACALAMQLAMERVNRQVEAMGLLPLQLGIGINTGEVVVGNIGSERRTKYGVVGSPVNLTGRIEAATVGGQVLIAASTRREAGPDVTVRRTIELAAKGFSAPLPLYEVEAIGAPYDLRLPAPDAALAPLAEPLPVQFHLLEGKHLSGGAKEGVLTAISVIGARLRTDFELEPLADLKLHLPSEAEGAGVLYAKALDRGEEGWLLRFTAVSEEVAEQLRELAAQSAA